MSDLLASRQQDSEQTRPPLPRLLTERPYRWLSRDQPDEGLIEHVLLGLRAYLDRAGFFWLCACAIFPKLQWDITLYLGQKLKTDEGSPLLSYDRLVDLARLPWFRHGYMPDWFRLYLISTLTPAQERDVRQTLDALLLNALTVAPHSLEIARPLDLPSRSILRHASQVSFFIMSFIFDVKSLIFFEFVFNSLFFIKVYLFISGINESLNYNYFCDFDEFTNKDDCVKILQDFILISLFFILQVAFNFIKKLKKNLSLNKNYIEFTTRWFSSTRLGAFMGVAFPLTVIAIYNPQNSLVTAFVSTCCFGFSISITRWFKALRPLLQISDKSIPARSQRPNSAVWIICNTLSYTFCYGVILYLINSTDIRTNNIKIFICGVYLMIPIVISGLMLLMYLPEEWFDPNQSD